MTLFSKFDELSKAVARGATRREVLRFALGMFGGAAFASIIPGKVTAEPPKSGGSYYTGEESEALKAGLTGYFAYEPAVYEKICVTKAEWFGESPHVGQMPDLYTFNACYIDDHGRCPSLPECERSAIANQFRFSQYTIPESKRNRDIGTDKYGRQVLAAGEESLRHSAGVIRAVMKGNGVREVFCIWTFVETGYDASYDPKKDPKLSHVVCNPKGFEEMRHNKNGTVLINPKTKKPFHAAICPPLLDCINDERSLTKGVLADGVPAPLHAAEVAKTRERLLNRSYSHPVRVGLGSMRVSEEPAWREIAGVPPPFPHMASALCCV